MKKLTSLYHSRILLKETNTEKASVGFYLGEEMVSP